MCTKTELQKITRTVVQSILELMENKIYKIVLYGSYARGDFDTEIVKIIKTKTFRF